MPDHAVEVHRRALADVQLEVADLVHPGQVVADTPRDAVGAVERRALGHVDDDLELVLVVVGEHLQRQQPQGGQDHRRHEQQADHPHRHPGKAWPVEDRPQQAVRYAVEWPGGDVVFLFARAGHEHVFQRNHGEPRCDDKRHHGRERHRERHIQGHRSHVGPHHAGDEHQGQKAGDDRKRRKNQRGADFLDGVEHRRAGFHLAHRKESGDVLDVGDRIVDQQAKCHARISANIVTRLIV